MKSLCILLCLIYAAFGQDINAIVKHNTKTYAFDGFAFLEYPDTYRASAFEVVGNVQTNKFTLTLPNTSAIVESSFVVGNNLYQFSGAYGTAYLSKYALPFAASPVAPVSQIKLNNQIQEIPAILDTKDNIAVALSSRYLTLIDLNPLTVADSVMAVVGTGKTPGALVYNNKSNKVYYFQTNYCFAGYCQHIYEYKVDIATGKLSQLTEAFTPNYTASFNKGALTGCSLNSDTIWCLNHETDKLYKFPLSNLNSHVSYDLPAGAYARGNIAFNFNANRAYVVSNNDYSFNVAEINLSSGVVTKSGTYSGGKVVSMSIVSNGQTLNLGHKFNGIRQMTSVNLSSFAGQLINLYV